MAAPTVLNTLSNADTVAENIKAALPAITVMAVNGALNFLAAIIILIVGLSFSRWVYRWVRRGLGRSHYVDETLKPLAANIVRYVVLMVTLVAVLGQFGVQTTSLIAVLGAAGLAIGLALQGTLSNVASGVMLLLLRPFRVNENISSGGTVGTVREIGLFQTVMITDDGIYVSVPNSTLFSGTIINNSRLTTRRVNVTLDVDYRSDLDQALKTIRNLLATDQRILPDPASLVQVASLAGPAANIQILAWTKTADTAAVQADLLKTARKALNGAGIWPAQPLAPSTPTGKP
jgi:small conductance mechanosensitive channel